MLPQLKPGDVAASVPGDLKVTALHLATATDWAARELGPVAGQLTENTPQHRAAGRAITYYALHVASTLKDLARRTSTASVNGALKSVEVPGEIKVERAVLNAAQLAALNASATSTWLILAEQALVEAGWLRPRPSGLFPGAAR